MSDDDTSISLSRGNGSFKSYSTRHGVGCWGKYPTGLVILNWDLSPIPGTENPQPETVDKEPEIPTQDKLQTQWVLKPRHVKLSKPRKVLKQSEERSQLKLSSFPRSRVQAVARTLFDDVKSKNDKVDFNELNQIVREMGLEPSNADLQQIRSTINFEEGDVIPQTTSFDDINQPISNWFTQHVLDLLAELASMSQVAGKLRVLKTVNAEFLRKEWSTAIPPADATPSLISTLEEMVRISICEKKRIPNSHTSTETDSCQQIFLSPLKEWTMLTLDEVAWRQGCMVKCERLNENTTSANCIGVTQFRIKSVALVRKLGTFIGRPLSHVARPLLDLLETTRSQFSYASDIYYFMLMFGPAEHSVHHAMCFMRLGCYQPAFNNELAETYLKNLQMGSYACYPIDFDLSIRNRNRMGISWKKDRAVIKHGFVICTEGMFRFSGSSDSVESTATIFECLDVNKNILSHPCGVDYSHIPWSGDGLGDGIPPLHRSVLLGHLLSIEQTLLRRETLLLPYVKLPIKDQDQNVSISQTTILPEDMLPFMSPLEVKKMILELDNGKFRHNKILEGLWGVTGSQIFRLCNNGENSLDNYIGGHHLALELKESLLQYRENYYKHRVNYKLTLLHCVVLSKTSNSKDAEKMADLLLTAGANTNDPDSNGSTPLCYAICNGSVQLAVVLLSHGAHYKVSACRTPPVILSLTPEETTFPIIYKMFTKSDFIPTVNEHLVLLMCAISNNRDSDINKAITTCSVCSKNLSERKPFHAIAKLRNDFENVKKLLQYALFSDNKGVLLSKLIAYVTSGDYELHKKKGQQNRRALHQHASMARLQRSPNAAPPSRLMVLQRRESAYYCSEMSPVGKMVSDFSSSSQQLKGRERRTSRVNASPTTPGGSFLRPAPPPVPNSIGKQTSVLELNLSDVQFRRNSNLTTSLL